MASWAKSSPLDARAAKSWALCVISSSCCGVAAAGSALLAREKLIELVRADIDVRDHVALPQGGQGQFLAHALTVLLVVHALRGERRRQLVEGDFIAARDLLQRAVQLLVGYRQADSLGLLRLNFLHDQPIENLLFEHALRGQFDFLLLQTLDDPIDLSVQLAFHTQAVVD